MRAYCQSLLCVVTLSSVSVQSDPSSVPQLAWQFVPVQKTVNPVLAFCKGDTVHFLLVSASLNIQNSEIIVTLKFVNICLAIINVILCLASEIVVIILPGITNRFQRLFLL